MLLGSSGGLLAVSGAPVTCLAGAAGAALPLGLAAATTAGSEVAALAFALCMTPLAMFEGAGAGVCAGVSAGVCMAGACCCNMVCLALQSRMTTRLQEGIDPPRAVCQRDLLAALCCTSCALVQESAALGLWGNFVKAEAEEEEEEEEEEEGAPKTKNCMSYLPTLKRR